MSFAQIHATPVECYSSDAEAPLQSTTQKGEAVWRGRVKFGILGSVVLVAVALIFVVAPVAPVVSKDLSETISLTDFTAAYYMVDGRNCPEDEKVSQDECEQAGVMLGAGVGIGYAGYRTMNNAYRMKGCFMDLDSEATKWNSASSGRTDSWMAGICRRKPEDMPDFAGLQKDAFKLEEYCLHQNKGMNAGFDSYKQCVLQILAWKGDGGDGDSDSSSKSDGGDGDSDVADDEVKKVKKGYCLSDRVGLGSDKVHGLGNPSLEACGASAKKDERCSGDGYFDAVNTGGHFQCKCPKGTCIGESNPTAGAWHIYQSR